MVVKFYFILSFLLLSLGTRGAVTTEILKEGKTWLYEYHQFKDADGTGYPVETVCQVEFMLQGDTLINARQYYKLLRIAKGISSYYCALREEGTTTYQVLPGETSERILMEFDPSRFIYTEYLYEYPEIIDTITVNGREFRRHNYTDEYNDYTIVAVESVGFYGNGLVMGMNFQVSTCLWCDYTIFKACYEDGQCIFTQEDFGAPTITSGIKTTNGQSLFRTTYNLLGRLGAKPRKGVYIENGRKRVVK